MDSRVISNLNAQGYLQENLFGDLRESLKDLLKYVQSSGELEKFWIAVEKENERARRNARRVDLERKRLEQGSNYASDEEEPLAGDTEYSVTDSYDSETDPEGDQSAEGELEGDLESRGGMTMKSRTQKSRFSKDNQFTVPFNPVRYLAMQLRDRLNERRHLQTHANPSTLSVEKPQDVDTSVIISTPPEPTVSQRPQSASNADIIVSINSNNRTLN